jgi:hypothetical protein
VRKIFLLESSSRGRFFLSVPLFVWRSLRLLRPVVLPAFHFLPLSILSREGFGHRSWVFAAGSRLPREPIFAATELLAAGSCLCAERRSSFSASDDCFQLVL